MTVEYLRPSQIEEHAEFTRIDAVNAGVAEGFPFDAESAAEFLLGYRLDFSSELPNGVLGMTTGKTIKLSQQLERNPGRLRFTVAHEIGHIVLHIPFLQMQSKQPTLFHVDREVVINRRMEIQADLFAAALLMPKAVITKVFGSQIQSGNPISIEELATYFGVSRQAAEIRLRELNIPKPSEFRMFSV